MKRKSGMAAGGGGRCVLWGGRNIKMRENTQNPWDVFKSQNQTSYPEGAAFHLLNWHKPFETSVALTFHYCRTQPPALTAPPSLSAEALRRCPQPLCNSMWLLQLSLQNWPDQELWALQEKVFLSVPVFLVRAVIHQRGEEMQSCREWFQKL